MSNKKTTSMGKMCDASDYSILPNYIREDLKRSGLSPVTQNMLKVYPVETDKALYDILGFDDFPEGSGDKILKRTQVYAITYPDGYIRVKLMTPLSGNNGHDVKYLSPSVTKNPNTSHCFYLMEYEKLANKSVPLFLVEGEKKSARTQQQFGNNGFSLGVAGVTMWKNALEKRNLKLKFSGRKCYIAFDYADIVGTETKPANTDVQRECFKLWLYLRKKKATNVFIVVWEDDLDCKGIDDYLVKHDNPDEMQLLMDNASANPFEALPLFQENTGYMRLAECIATSFYSKEEYKALWQEFDLSNHYGIKFEAFNDLIVKELHKNNPEEEKPKPFSEIIKVVPSETKDIEYLVTNKGIFKAEKQASKTSEWLEYTRICADAVQITERYVDIFGESAQVKLSWGTLRPKSMLVPETWLSGHAMTCLTDKGIRIQTPNGKDMAEYFLACLNEMDGEKTSEFASHNGWVDQKDYSEFVCGNNIITADGTKPITFAPSSDTIVGKTGNKTEWELMLTPYAKDPLFQIIMGASAASPLLKPLGIDPLIFHLYGDSSCGKSFYARFAASLWGKARGEGNLLAGWDGTRIGPEQYFAMMNHLPAFLDDSQEAPSDEVVRRIAQSYVNGKSRTRGALQANGGVGLAKSACWHGILISTGEKKLTDTSNYSGLSARIVELYKNVTTKISQADFLDVNLCLQKNYGFGDEIIIHFINNKDAIKARVKDLIRKLETQFPELPPEKNRSLSTFATVIAGIEICSQLYGFPADNEGIIKILDGHFLQNEARGSQGAYEFLLETFARNRPKFGEMKFSGTRKLEDGTVENIYKYNVANAYEKTEGVHSIENEIGIYHPGINAICFYPQKMRELLEEAGFSISQVSSILKEKNLLVTSQGSCNRFAMKIAGVKQNFYAVKTN